MFTVPSMFDMLMDGSAERLLLCDEFDELGQWEEISEMCDARREGEE